MKKLPSKSNPTRLALVILTAASALLGLSSCYYGAFGGVYGGEGHDHRPPYGNLKPKEKAHLGYGPHAGHPHGGPPGQLKKRGYYD